MKVRVNRDSDPISLTLIAANGAEHAALDAANGENIEMALVVTCGRACGYAEPYGFVPEGGCPVHD